MSIRVILQPAGSGPAAQHFRDTIANPVPIERVLSHVAPQERAALSLTFGSRKAIPVWGVVPGERNVNVRRWERIQRGDVCRLCRRELPVSLLVAAHIKKRAECEPPEKGDYQNVVAPMCKLGCDDLFERGFVSVDHQGKVVVVPGATCTPDLAAALQPLLGAHCSAWNNGSKKYFAHHYKRSHAQFGSQVG